MTTKLVGLKEFRQNLSSLTKLVETKQVRLIVLKKNKPVLEVNPIFDDEEATLEALGMEKQIAKAREQVKKGEVYTLEEVRKRLDL